jgi:hypothetical protein
MKNQHREAPILTDLIKRLRAIAARPFHEHYRVTVRQAADALASQEPVAWLCEGENPGVWNEPKHVIFDIETVRHRLSQPEYWTITPLFAYPVEPITTKGEAENHLKWVVERWNAEVRYRPLSNIHRRTLDDTWRQVIRHFDGDPNKLVGPDHDTLLDQVAEIAKGKR